MVNFASPLYNLVGFEHAPRDERDCEASASATTHNVCNANQSHLHLHMTLIPLMFVPFGRNTCRKGKSNPLFPLWNRWRLTVQGRPTDVDGATHERREIGRAAIAVG